MQTRQVVPGQPSSYTRAVTECELKPPPALQQKQGISKKEKKKSKLTGR